MDECSDVVYGARANPPEKRAGRACFRFGQRSSSRVRARLHAGSGWVKLTGILYPLRALAEMFAV